MNRTARLFAVSLTALALTSACATTKTDTPSTATSKAAALGSATAPQLRLGYFANVTHASAVYGVGEGVFAKELGSTTKLKTQVFNAGPAAVEALFGGALDAAYLGPNPAINAFVKSRGEAVRIIAGATSGGAALVVRPDITSPAQLKGKKLEGTWVLVRTRGSDSRSWLLMKHRDDAASTEDVVVERPKSVLSNRLMAEIAFDEGGEVERAAGADPEDAIRALMHRRGTRTRVPKAHPTIWQSNRRGTGQ